MVSFFKIVESLTGFLLLYCVLDACCQRIRFEDPSPESCSADTTCRPMRRCRPYRDLPDWQTIGMTCGSGRAEHRKICCPKYFAPPKEQTLATTTTTTSTTPTPTERSPTRPPTRTPSPNVNIINGSGIRFEDPSPQSCSADTTCRPMRRCRPYRDLPNWQTIGVTCGSGRAELRKICCPKYFAPPKEQPLVTTTTTSTTPTPTARSPTRPPTRTPSPNVNIINGSGPNSSTKKCPSDSTCKAIRHCRAFRGFPSSHGVTCGPGQGESRRVCCPPLKRTGSTAAPKPPTLPVDQPIDIPDDSDGSGCGKSRKTLENVREKYIIGGENSTQGQWPWMVAIPIVSPFGSASSHCGGVLIDNIHVMSAAHCFENRTVTNYQARIGHIDLTRCEIFSIIKISVPEGYRRGRYYYDIAILTLDREVSPALANPICLPDETVLSMSLTATGTAVAGWGSIDLEGTTTLTLKHLQHMPVWSNSDCENVFRREFSSFRSLFPHGVDNSFICAGYSKGGKDSCQGDSGGPLMKQKNNRWFVVGIVSFGNSCGRPNMPGGYARVSEYMDWIQENIRD